MCHLSGLPILVHTKNQCLKTFAVLTLLYFCTLLCFCTLLYFCVVRKLSYYSADSDFNQLQTSCHEFDTFESKALSQ
jgi:hypothetical protein